MKPNQVAVTPISSNPFKDKGEEPVVEPNTDLVEVLQRYDAAIRALVLRRVRFGFSKPYTLLDKEIAEVDIGKNIQTSLLDFSVSHALQGKDYINDNLVNMQYTVLQAALILTITVPLFINPPEFIDEKLGHAFSAVVGFSSMCHLGCIISCTVITATLNAPYTEVDTLVARVESFFLNAATTVFNYVAIITAIAAMALAAFERTMLDGWVFIGYCGVITIALLVLVYLATGKAIGYQDQRTYHFYKKYCDASGELKDEYLEMIRTAKDKPN